MNLNLEGINKKFVIQISELELPNKFDVSHSIELLDAEGKDVQNIKLHQVLHALQYVENIILTRMGAAIVSQGIYEKIENVPEAIQNSVFDFIFQKNTFEDLISGKELIMPKIAPIDFRPIAEA